MEYRVFFLSREQQAPEGSTGKTIPSNSGIIWEGKAGTFPKTAAIDRKEIGASFKYENHVMSKEEIDEYNLLLKYTSVIKDGFENLISFEEFKDSATFEAAKTSIKSTIDGLSRL